MTAGTPVPHSYRVKSNFLSLTAVHRRYISLLLLLIALAIVGADRADGSVPAETARHSSTPVLSGSELDYPPYRVVKQDGQPDGFSVELFRAALKAMGREVTFKLGPWAGLKQDLAAERLQALPLVASFFGRAPCRGRLPAARGS